MKPKQPSKKRELNGQPYPDNPYGWPYDNSGKLIQPEDGSIYYQAEGPWGILRLGEVNCIQVSHNGKQTIFDIETRND